MILELSIGPGYSVIGSGPVIFTSGASATWYAYAQVEAKAQRLQAVGVIYVVITPFLIPFLKFIILLTY